MQLYGFKTLVVLMACKNALGHSWIEYMQVIDQKSGTFTGAKGYMRSFPDRRAPGFTDTQAVHILPKSDPKEEKRSMPDPNSIETQGVTPTDAMCRKSQRTPNQTPGYPVLQVAPGSAFSINFLENGHVTLPENSPGKEQNRGTVYVYATKSPKAEELFLDVYKKWDASGKGGDGRGKLLNKFNFDDGRCHQINNSPISKQRQQQFPSSMNELPCQVDVAMPQEAKPGETWTIYWVWMWPTVTGPVHAEIYTSCADVLIVGGKKPSPKRRNLLEVRGGTDYVNQAIPAYMQSITQSPTSQPTSSQAPKPTTTAEPTSHGKSATSAPPASQPSNPSSEQKAAEAAVLSALGSKLVSELASKLTASVATPAVKTVTVTSVPASSSARAAAPSVDVTTGTTTTMTQVSIATQMPTSLEFAAPAMSPATFSGTASPAPGNTADGGQYKRACHGCRGSRIMKA